MKELCKQYTHDVLKSVETRGRVLLTAVYQGRVTVYQAVTALLTAIMGCETPCTLITLLTLARLKASVFLFQCCQ